MNTSTSSFLSKPPSGHSLQDTLDNTVDIDQVQPRLLLRTLLAEQQVLQKAVNDGFASIHTQIDELSSKFGMPANQRSSTRPSYWSRDIGPLMSVTPSLNKMMAIPTDRGANGTALRNLERNPKFKVVKRQARLRPFSGSRASLDYLDMDHLPENADGLTLHPDSQIKLWWDFLSMLIALWDLIFVPYFFAWSVGSESLFAKVSAYVVCVFWTLDIPLNFVSGYYNKEAEAERRLVLASLRYLRTWCLLDVVLATVDWTMLQLDRSGTSHAFQAQQIFRICKLVVRVPSKIPRAMDLYARLLLRFDKESYHSMLEILRWVLLLVLSNHILACLWYSIGEYPIMCGIRNEVGTCEKTWLTEPGMIGKSELYQYLTALHWCVTQMTPASMEVVPENAGERLVTILIILIGLILGTSLIATMTSIVTSVRVDLDVKLRNTVQLQRFLAQESVPTEIGLLVMRQVTWRLKQKPRLQTSDVAYINLASKSLQAELKHAIHMNHLYYHNFFGMLDALDRDYTRALCNVLTAVGMSKKDLLFEDGRHGLGIYFITTGAARYFPGLHAYEFGKGHAKTHMEATSWLSEPALWLCEWTHLGTCVVEMQSEILSLDADGLVLCARRDKGFQSILDTYSKAFQDFFNQSPTVSDCAGSYDPADVFHSLELHNRLHWSLKLIQTVHSVDSAQKNKIEMLKAEVEAGKSSITIGPEHGVMRTVFLASLKVIISDLESPTFSPNASYDSSEQILGSETLDGFVAVEAIPALCEVAEYNAKTCTYEAKCVLPGSKRIERESAVGAIDRLLNGYLQELMCVDFRVDYQSFEDNSFSQMSPTYGLHTRYVKTCFKGTMTRNAASAMPTITAVPPYTWTARSESLEAAREAQAVEQWSWRKAWKGHQRVSEWITKAQAAEDLLKSFDEIVCLDKGKRWYLWLTPEQMNVLLQEEATGVLKKWIERNSSRASVCTHVESVENEVAHEDEEQWI